MSRIAIVDMGTNTFHLLIADTSGNDYRIIHRSHEAVKIGQGGINEGFITEPACARAMAAMERFAKTIDENEVTTRLAFATSAFRNAGNGHDLAAAISSRTGIPVRIISGDEEADYIFEGIMAALDPGDETSLVMDIGAGSVEFIIAKGRTLSWKQSFEIGGQRLLEKFQKHDPITPAEIGMLDTYFRQELIPLEGALATFCPRILIGSSGTFDTLSDIFCIRQQLPRTHDAPETPLSIAGFYDLYGELIQKNRRERMQIEGMIELRVDMIVVSCCLIRYLLEVHRFESIRVSGYSLKEGVLASLARSGIRP